MNRHYMSFLTTLLHPKSIGEIRLRTANYRDYPLIDPHYLEQPDDVKAIIAGILS